MLILTLGLADQFQLDLQRVGQLHIQALKLEQELAEEREASEKTQRMESDLRFQLASSMAHRINNPLNFVELGLYRTRLQLHSLRQGIEALLGEAPPDNTEAAELHQLFSDLLASFDSPLADMKLGVQRASESVREIRALSGVDGGAMNFIEAKILWDYTLERFTELLPSGATMRLAASYCGPPQLAILGNLYVLKSAIELLLLVTHQVTVGPIVCSFAKGQGDSWRLQVEGQFSWNQSLKMALERCVNGVLGSSAQKAQFAFAAERIEVEFSSITPQALAFSP